MWISPDSVVLPVAGAAVAVLVDTAEISPLPAPVELAADISGCTVAVAAARAVAAAAMVVRAAVAAVSAVVAAVLAVPAAVAFMVAVAAIAAIPELPAEVVLVAAVALVPRLLLVSQAAVEARRRTTSVMFLEWAL